MPVIITKAGMSPSSPPNPHAASHTDGSDDIQDASNSQKGLATAAQITAIEANTSKVSADGSVTDHNDVSNAGSGQIITAGERTQITDNKNDISALTTGYSRRTKVISIIADNTAAPPTEVSGDRYILSVGGGAPNANWDGAAAGDIVDFNGATWDATTPVEGYVAYVDGLNKDALYVDDGAPVWEEREVAVADHNDLQSIQGGGVGEFNHLTDAELSDVQAIDEVFTTAEKSNLGNQSGTNTNDEVSATETVEGIVERATQAEVDAGSDTTRYLSPATLAARNNVLNMKTVVKTDVSTLSGLDWKDIPGLATENITPGSTSERFELSAVVNSGGFTDVGAFRISRFFVTPPSTAAVTSISSTGLLATCTTTAAHGLTTNDIVDIAGSSDTDYNGEFAIVVTGASTFTYLMIADPGDDTADGTITFQHLGRVLAHGDDTGTAHDSVGAAVVPFSANYLEAIPLTADDAPADTSPIFYVVQISNLGFSAGFAIPINRTETDGASTMPRAVSSITYTQLAA